MNRYMLLLAIAVSCISVAAAQYYNPYVQQQMNQQAYEAGRRMAEQMQQQMDSRDSQTVNGCISRIGQAIARRDFEEAECWAQKLLKLREDHGYYYLGLTNELQGYDDYAVYYYEKGASIRSKACKRELERINTYGTATEEQIDNVVNYYVQLEVMSYNMAAQITNDVWGNSVSNSNSSNQSRSSQKANCSICHGTGYDLTPYQHCADAAGLHNNAGNSCRLCGRSTDHWHYRCRH